MNPHDPYDDYPTFRGQKPTVWEWFKFIAITFFVAVICGCMLIRFLAYLLGAP